VATVITHVPLLTLKETLPVPDPPVAVNITDDDVAGGNVTGVFDTVSVS
jgi:hypothetical protein